MWFKQLLRYKIPGMLVLFLLSVSVLAQENLIRNGDMELGEGNPANWGMWGWQMKNAIFRLETGVAHSGKRFATIINNENNDARFIQEVLVETGKIYRISGWIKTENVGTGEGVKGASISLLEDGNYSTLDIKGSNGKWEYEEFFLQTGSDVKKVTISLCVGGLRKVNTGKASFDDVEMMEIAAIPLDSPVLHYNPGQDEEPSVQPDDSDTENTVADETQDPATKQPWFTNPLIIVVLILVAVIISALVILFFSPKEKNNDIPAEDDSKTVKKDSDNL